MYACSVLSGMLAQVLKVAVFHVTVYGYFSTMAANMLFNSSACQFHVLAARTEALFLLSQKKNLGDVATPFKGEGDVHSASFDYLVSTDDALRYVTCVMFDLLQSLV